MKHYILIACAIFFFMPVGTPAAAQSIDSFSRAELIQVLRARIAELLAERASNPIPVTQVDGRARILGDWHQASTNSSCVASDETGWVYCFGGRDVRTLDDDLHFYEPEGRGPGALTNMMPYLYASSCAPDSSTGDIYCFGGYEWLSAYSRVVRDSIYKYEPSREADTDFETLDTTMPFGTAGMSCAEDSHTHLIYCFGGFVDGWEEADPEYAFRLNEGEQAFANYVMVFDPTDESVEVIEFSKLVGGDDLTCAYARSERLFYCFGGDTGWSISLTEGSASGNETDAIFSFDPRTQRVDIVKDTLPEPLAVMSCVAASDQDIYCFGGTYPVGPDVDADIDYILRFDPRTEQLEVLEDTLPQPLAGHSCVQAPQDDEIIYCFGGNYGDQASVIEFQI